MSRAVAMTPTTAGRVSFLPASSRPGKLRRDMDLPPTELFDTSSVLASLGPQERALLDRLDVVFELDSTNRFLRDQATASSTGARACLADRQTAGQGRCGRPWVAPLGNVYLSVSWSFGLAPAELQGLSLAAGVAAARVVHGSGSAGVRLKWPNDVVCGSGKLGGILIEIASSGERSCRVVVGVGLNVAMTESPGLRIDQPWTDMSRLMGRRLNKNAVAGRLLAELLRTLHVFEHDGGFSAFCAAWAGYDCCRDRRVVVRTPKGHSQGVARGVDAHGRLLLEVEGSVQTVVSGDVSLRMVP